LREAAPEAALPGFWEGFRVATGGLYEGVVVEPEDVFFGGGHAFERRGVRSGGGVLGDVGGQVGAGGAGLRGELRGATGGPRAGDGGGGFCGFCEAVAVVLGLGAEVGGDELAGGPGGFGEVAADDFVGAGEALCGGLDFGTLGLDALALHLAGLLGDGLAIDSGALGGLCDAEEFSAVVDDDAAEIGGLEDLDGAAHVDGGKLGGNEPGVVEGDALLLQGALAAACGTGEEEVEGAFVGDAAGLSGPARGPGVGAEAGQGAVRALLVDAGDPLVNCGLHLGAGEGGAGGGEVDGFAAFGEAGGEGFA